MIVNETKTVRIILNQKDIVDAILMLLKRRGFKDIQEQDVKLSQDRISAAVEIIETVDNAGSKQEDNDT